MENFSIKSIKIIVGLGNLGKDYVKSRHNAGFLFVEHLAGASSSFSEDKKLNSLISKTEIDGNSVRLAKPTTMMNNSGLAINKLLDYYKIDPEELLLVFDDLDIKLGDFKIQYSRGPKGHNGLISTENFLSTPGFWRLRVGVENRPILQRKFFKGTDYVLGKFSEEEQATLAKTFDTIHKIFLDKND